MKYALLLFLLTKTVFSYSQFFVGDSRVLAKSILDTKKIDYSEDLIEEPYKIDRISWIIENEYQMILIFNTDDVVIKQTLIPEKKNGVNEFVKWFNEEFVVVSNTEWKNYANGRIYNIKLEYILREPLFSITLVE